MVKDVGIAMEPGNRLDLPTPLSGLGQHLWKAARLYSDEGSSISEMVRWVEHMTGIEITPGSER